MRTNKPQTKHPKYPLHGWINLNKPFDMTSTQAVSAVKRILSPAKIGHAGTLDPLATGVLPLALGDATKTVQYMMDATKCYRFTVCFGSQTDTDDVEGAIIATSAHRPATADIEAVLSDYTGTIEQLPPTYSALKVNGQRAYDLARSGEDVVLQPRLVRIDTLTLVSRPDEDHVELEAICGKGTYIRSLARDIATQLGSCGHISALKRVSVGSFHADSAISLDDLEKHAKEALPAYYGDFLQPIERALDDIPAVLLDHTQSQQLRHGHSCLISPSSCDDGPEEALYKALQGKRLVALVKRTGRQIAPIRVFNH